MGCNFNSVYLITMIKINECIKLSVLHLGVRCQFGASWRQSSGQFFVSVAALFLLFPISYTIKGQKNKITKGLNILRRKHHIKGVGMIVDIH